MQSTRTSQERKLCRLNPVAPSQDALRVLQASPDNFQVVAHCPVSDLMRHLKLPGPELEGGPRSCGCGVSIDFVVLGVKELRPD